MATTAPPISDLVEKLAKVMVGSGARHLVSVRFPFEPKAASRPRVGKWSTYYAKPYAEWMRAAAEYLKGPGHPIDSKELLFVVVESVSTRAKASKLTTPNYDTDNSAKGPMDMLTEAGKPKRATKTRLATPGDPARQYWKDDKQVALLLSAKRFTEPDEPAHTAVHIYALA